MDNRSRVPFPESELHPCRLLIVDEDHVLGTLCFLSLFLLAGAHFFFCFFPYWLRASLPFPSRGKLSFFPHECSRSAIHFTLSVLPRVRHPLGLRHRYTHKILLYTTDNNGRLYPAEQDLFQVE